MAAQLITTDKLQPGDKVEHRRNGDRFTVDSVTPSSTDWRFHTPGAAQSETGMEIVGHDADGGAVHFTAAQSCQWWVIELAAREETQLHATADDSYATCPRCKWAGKLREDGTMRKHRESVDMGRLTMSGGLPQQSHGDICKGSGEKPWEPGLPEGYELPKQNEHGGWESVTEAKPDAPEPETPKQVPGTLVDPWTWLRRAGDPYTRNPRP